MAEGPISESSKGSSEVVTEVGEAGLQFLNGAVEDSLRSQ